MNELYKTVDDFLDNSVRIPGQPAWLVFCGYAIGETATFCALAGEFKKEHGHEIVIVITPKHQGVVNLYVHQFAKIVVVPDETMRTILRSGYIPQDRFELNQAFSPCWIDRGFRESDGIRFLWKYPGRGGISDTDLARMVLHLPWDSKLEPPRISSDVESRVLQLAVESGIKIGKSVLLCPINNSAPKFPTIFWSELARLLSLKGLKVFTNMGGLNKFNGLSTMPIEGTTPIDLPIEYVIPFTRLAGHIISGANGMFFLIALSENKKFELNQLISYSQNALASQSSRGFRSSTHPEIGNHIVAGFQYLAPELCLNINLHEFLFPNDADDSEFLRLAKVLANKDINDSSYVLRKGTGSSRYIEEYKDWLIDLRDCEN
jgi:hypothetical protein